MDIFATKEVSNMDVFVFTSCVFVLSNFLSKSHENLKQGSVEVTHI